MDKDMKKFKEMYLNELSNEEGNKEKLKDKIGIKKGTVEAKAKTSGGFFSMYKKPLIIGGSCVMAILIAIITVISIINFRNTPVYQGMDADNMGTVRASKRYDGHDDHDDDDDDHRREELIDDVEQQIGVIIDNRIVCYAQPNEQIIITVQIDNPKFYEILSFTLNGRLYQSYEFVDGSDSTRILVKFTVQAESGLQEVTIDAIKYVDNTSIKNARFGADKTIKLGVTYQNPPVATDVNEIVNGKDFAVSFSVQDQDQLININSGLNIYLFDGEQLVSQSKLVLGFNVIPYSNLKLGWEYTYAIIGVYDLYDGAGKRAYVLHQNTFTTPNGYTYASVEATYDSFNVTYDTLNGFEGSITEVKVYKGEEEVQTITEGFDNLVIGNLLSNNEYVIKTTYKYSLTVDNAPVEYTQTIEYVAKTLERPIPTVEFVEDSVTQDSISFNYNITDTTTVGKISKIEVYRKGELVSSFDEDIRLFENLLSDNDYKFIVTYEYDLLDGNGVKTLTAEYTYHTIKKTVPTAVFTSALPISNMVYIMFEVNDIDSIIELISIDLYKGDEKVTSVTEWANYNPDQNTEGLYSGNIVVSGLESGDYTAVFVYKYDMCDGNAPLVVDKDHPTADNKLGFTLN